MAELRKLIKEKGITKEHLIKTTGISRNKFYIGLDALNVFQPTELKAIATALGVSVKKLME